MDYSNLFYPKQFSTILFERNKKQYHKDILLVVTDFIKYCSIFE